MSRGKLLVLCTANRIGVSREAKEQWEKSTPEDYRERIKSCYNCDYWAPCSSREYHYNTCLQLDPNQLVSFDSWCPMYCGNAPEDNLLMRELAKVVE